MEVSAQQLRCFLAVAEELNFTRAAARLHLSPSTASEQITLLERRLGRSLFLRSSRSVRCTPAADELLPLARQAVAALDAVAAWAKEPDTGSTIVVGVMASSEQFRALLTAARAAAPGADWRIRQLGFQPPFEALLKHELDAAVLAELGPPRSPKGIDTHDLWREPLVLVARDGHPLVERRRVRLDDLAGEKLICGPSGLKNPQWFAVIHALVPGGVTVLQTATNLEEAVEMCATGIGLMVATESVMHMYPRPGLAFIPLHQAPVATTRLHVRRGDPARAISVLSDLSRR